MPSHLPGGPWVPTAHHRDEGLQTRPLLVQTRCAVQSGFLHCVPKEKGPGIIRVAGGHSALMGSSTWPGPAGRPVLSVLKHLHCAVTPVFTL